MDIIKKFRKISLLVFLIPLAFYDNVNALSLTIPDSSNDIQFYSKDCFGGSSETSVDLSSVSPGSGEPNGLTYPNLDATKMADAIEKFIAKHVSNSPLKGTSKVAVASAKSANISPFLAYAHALNETSLATASGAGKMLSVAHNSFGRSATQSQPHIDTGGSHLWYSWSSFSASLDSSAAENKSRSSGDWFSYDRAVYSSEIDQGLSAYANRYAPPGENDTAGYIKKIQASLDEMAGYAGATISSSSSSSSSSASSADSSSSSDISSDVSTSSTSSTASTCCDSPSSTSAGGTVTTMSDNTETALAYLIQQGLNLTQAAGIVGSLQQESGVNPKASNNGQYLGIAQWDSSRWKTENEFASDAGGDPYDLAIQLRYMAWESGLTAGWSGHTASRAGTADAVKAATTVEAAVSAWSSKFEGCGQTCADSKRITYAKAIVAKYQDSSALGSSSPTDSSSSTSSTGCTSTGSGSGDVSALQAYVLKYAWPTHRSGIAETSGYQAAIAKAKSEGRFYGGCDGADCGGFVTTLLYDSGWDKTYNSNAKGGGTGDQEAWAKQHWTYLGTANSTYEPDGSKFTVDKLQPGDVAFVPGHTWIYVGKIDGFSSEYASASLCDRAPMAGTEGFTYNSPRWYRKK